MSVAHENMPPGPVEVSRLPQHDRFINREASWLEFNRRVLQEAQGTHQPLLERMMFLSISANNLDEFFMKRIGGLKRQSAAGVTSLSIDGQSPREQLARLRQRVIDMIEDQCGLLHEHLLPQLGKKGVRLLRCGQLDEAALAWVEDYFESMILPILTPLGVGPGQPFPFISNLSLSLAVMVRAPEETVPRFARVKVPANRPRFVPIPDSLDFVPLEEIIARFIGRLFIGMQVIEAKPFRVTRNADLERNEEEADDLLETIEEELRNRRFAPIVRMETVEDISHDLLGWLVTELEVDPDVDVYRTAGPLGLTDIKELARIDLPKEHFPPHQAVTHPAFRKLEEDPPEVDIFDVIRKQDVLVHHPYQSFATSVLALLQAAATDPKVLAIKQTLYRTAPQSPIVAALLKAAEHGKEVNVQVEIKARFDEANNIEWVRKLEKVGVHVTYGFIGLKTHCKTMLIVRDEPEGIRRYVHVGTGNYHTLTARLYTDLGLFTCDPALCQDVADLYNYLTGHSKFRDYNKLLVAPLNMRNAMLGMIEREIEHVANGREGHIVAKMNQLEDRQIIQALYAASQAGVQIDLIVRGFCCLRPGVPGLSENIRVMSIIGRFLEHSRIFHFHNGGAPVYYIGSADWMSRNLDYRVEALAPIESPVLQRELEMLLKTSLADHAQAWDLMPDGSYVRRRPRRGKGSQSLLASRAQRGAQAKTRKDK